MTKEQEEAIKDVKNYIHDIISESIDEDGYTRYEISEEEQEFFNNIEKLLNILKEKDAEIEKYKKLLADNLAKGLNDSIKAKSKAENDLYDFAEGVQEDLDTKDKIINLMAERINWLCKTNGILLDKEHGENFDKEDIKQWFERKVEKC